MNSTIPIKELEQIDFFRKRSRESLDPKLNLYKRNLILIGAFILFYIFGDVNLKTVNAVLIQGDINNEIAVSIFSTAFFIYSSIMFWVYSRREVSKIDASRNLLKDFTVNVASHIYRREMNKVLNQLGLGSFVVGANFSAEIIDDDPRKVKCFTTVTGDDFINNYLSEFVENNEIELKDAGGYKSVPDGSVGKNIIWRYQLSEDLDSYFNKNTSYLKSLHVYEFFELKVPLYFIISVLGCVLYFWVPLWIKCNA